MGKRKPSSVDTTKSTGIYDRRPEPTSENLKAAFVRGDLKPMKPADQLEALLADAERIASTIWTAHKSGQWDATWGDESETSSDARSLLGRIGFVRKFCRLNVHAEALPHAIIAGMLLERIRAARPAEPHTARGLVVVDAAAKGGRQRAKLDDDQRAAAVSERDKLVAAGHSKNDASNLIAQRLGVSGKTISRL